MSQVTAQNNDIQAIETTINHYFNGMIKHDAASFEKAFNTKASMKWVDDKGYQDVNAVAALSEYVNNNDPAETETRIMSINITGDAANAQLELEYATFYFVDFMHLLKIDGEWKIVSKTYTTVPKGSK